MSKYEFKEGRFRLTVEGLSRYHPHPAPHDYGIPAQAWRRAAKFIQRFGVDEALAVMDARAEACIDRGNVRAATRWRDIMAAVHAVAEDEDRLSSH